MMTAMQQQSESTSQQTTTDSNRLLALDVTRLFATLCLVILHSCDVLLDGSDSDPSHWWIGFSYASFCICCVPLFTMCSGALLMTSQKTQPINTFYSKRLPKLIFPLFAWGIIYYLFDHPPHEITFKNIFAYLTTFLDGKGGKHLWFLYMLLGVYLSAPFLVLIENNPQKSFIRNFIALCFLLSVPDIICYKLFDIHVFLPYSIFSTFVGYFAFGHYIFHNMNKSPFPRKRLLKITFLSFAATLILCLFLHLFWKRFSILALEYSNPNIILLAFGLFTFFTSFSYNFLRPFSKTIARISAASYGVYLIHLLIMNLLRNGTFGFCLTPYSLDPFFGLPLSALAVLVVSFVAVFALKRIPVARLLVP